MTSEETSFRGRQVRLVTLTPRQSERFHAQPIDEQHRRLEKAGFVVRKGYAMSNDSDGTVHIYQPIS